MAAEDPLSSAMVQLQLTDGADTIQAALSQFRKNRGKVQEVFTTTEELLEKMAAELSNASILEKFKEALFDVSEKRRLEMLHRGDGEQDRPCLVFIGQTKAGKSTLINELLGGTFVAQAQTPCTARVTRLSYSKEAYVRVVSKAGEQLRYEKLENKKIPEDMLALSEKDRYNEVEVTARVDAGVESDFLRSGVDVVDSPGRNENPELDKLTNEVVNNLLPLIIYVIDGRMLVTDRDVADIRAIKRSAPGVEICFVLTKLDPEPNQQMMQQVEDDETPEETEQKLTSEKEQRVYRRLTQEGFLPESVKLEDCPVFHALSLWKVREWRRQNDRRKKNKMELLPQTQWIGRFYKFRNSLHNFVESRLVDFIMKAVSQLQECHTRILTIFIDKASDIVTHERRTRAAIQSIKQLEGKLYNEATDRLKKSQPKLRKAIGNFLAKVKPEILASAATIDPTEGIEDLPEDGTVTSSDIVSRCVQNIREAVLDKLNTEFSNFLSKEIFEDHNQLLNDIMNQTQDLEKDIPQTPAFVALKKTMIKNYALTNTDFFAEPSIAHRVRRFFHSMAEFIMHPVSFVAGRYPIKDPKWKKEQVTRFLETIDKNKFIESQADELTSYFENAHINFTNALKRDEELLEGSLKLNETERERIISMSPWMAAAFMQAFAITSEYEYADYVQDGEASDAVIGRGAQGIVYRMKSKKTGKAIAMKSILVNSQSFDDLAMEAYYSSQLKHERLLPIKGLKIVPREDPSETGCLEVQMFMEIMKEDVTKYLKRNSGRRVETLRKRLEIGLQVAEGIQVLHNMGLMHRDIKLQNILLDESEAQACLTDFGLTKPFGMHKDSFVGTPLHMAPEIITNKNHDHSVDVYAFVVLLWYLFDGTGVKHPDYVRLVPNVGAVLACAANANMRPERLEGMTDEFWKLLCDGWAKDPKERPNIAAVISRLSVVINKLPAPRA